MAAVVVDLTRIHNERERFVLVTNYNLVSATHRTQGWMITRQKRERWRAGIPLTFVTANEKALLVHVVYIFGLNIVFFRTAET